MTLKFPVSVVVTAFDKATGPLRNVESKLAQWGRRVANVGKSLSTWITTPLVTAGGLAIFEGLQFEKSLQKIRVFGDTGGAAFDEFRERLKAMGSDGVFSANSLAEAMADMADETKNFDRVMESLVPTAQLAKILDIVPKEAADRLEKFSLIEPSFQRVADIIAGIAGTQPGKGKDFVEALATMIPTAKAVGISLAPAAKLMAMLSGQAEFGPEKAASGARGLVLQLQQRGELAVLQDLPTWLAKLRYEGLQGAPVLEKFGKRAGTALNALLNADPFQLRALQDNIGMTGEAARWSGRLSEGAAGEWQKFGAAIRGFFLDLADSGVLSTFVEILKDFRDVLKGFAGLSPEWKKRTVMGLMATAGIGPALQAGGAAAGWLGFLGARIPGLAPVLAKALTGVGVLGAVSLLTGDTPGAGQVRPSGVGGAGVYEGPIGRLFEFIASKFSKQPPIEIRIINAPPGTRVIHALNADGINEPILDFGRSNDY